MKLHLGAGKDIKENWVNHDLVQLRGIDVTHDLNVYPWPWANELFDEVFANNLLEHIPDVVQFMEELYRITKPGAKVYLGVPYWNSWEAITDPTHCSQFNEFTFEFFDPNCHRCQNRFYYSTARFHIRRLGYGICLVPSLRPNLGFSYKGRRRLIFESFFPFKYTVIHNSFLKKILSIFASYLNNVIIGLEVHLERSE